MLKLSIVLIVAATSLAACDAPTKAKHWEYRHEEDRLRGMTTTTAILESKEDFDNGDDEEPQMILTITRGSADENANGVVFSSGAYGCRQPIKIRVDDSPIQQVPGSTGGDCLKLAEDSDLAKRIAASKEVVMELDGAGGPQMTFHTDGLDLSSRQQ